MRKIYTSVVLAMIVGLLNVSSVSAINLEYINSPTTSCAGANVNAIEYISGNNISKFIGDEFFSPNQHIISDGSTTVQMYRSSSNLVNNCTSSSDWKRISSYAPGGGQSVVALGSNCTFNKPTNKNNRNVQFVYKVGYYDIVPGANTWNAVYYKNTSEIRNNTPNMKLLSNVDVANFKTHANECLNVELRYCGDGILSRNEGEVCDPEDALQRGWGNGGCNQNTCQPINEPACNSLTVSPNSGTSPLDVTATCEGFQVNTWQIDCGNGQTFSGNGNGSGMQSFSRVCNYTGANTYTPRCTINGTLTNNSCQKTVYVNEPVAPSITVDKTDYNIFDLDGDIGGNDSQTVEVGENAVFRITVRNNGPEALENIRLLDPLASACATNANTFVNLSAGNFVNGDNVTTNITFGGAGNHGNNTLEPNETFEYTCQKSNTTEAYTNVVEVRGVGVTSGQSVDASDPTQVLIPTVEDGYDLALRKTVSTSTPGPFRLGDTVTFDIEVFNQGSEDASNIEITDYIPTGLTLNDANWTQSGNRATRTIASIDSGESETVSITFTIDADAPKIVKNLAEISSDDGDDCDSTPDNNPANDGIIVNDAIGTACEPGGDEDDHDIEEITVTDSTLDDYDLALRKTLVGATTVYEIGDSVTFNIEVFNQGDIDAANIVVTDYIPAGLSLNDSNWSQSGETASRVYSFLRAGESANLNITFNVDADATGTIRNIAEISSDDGDDCDSTTDTNSANDNLVDDAIGVKCDSSTTDEDDHDIAEITIDPSENSACTTLTASPTSAQNSLTSTLTCSGSGATSYLLEVRNSSNSVVFSSTNSSDSVTLNSVGSYTASCFVNGETTTRNACVRTLQVTNDTGNSGPSCSDVIQNGSQVTCVGNRRVKSIKLNCETEVPYEIEITNPDGSTGTGIEMRIETVPLINANPTVVNSKRVEATFTCVRGVAECEVNSRVTTDPDNSGWRSRGSGVCSTTKTAYCGDGVLDTEAGEVCDFGSAADWGKCNRSTCKFDGGRRTCDPETEICCDPETEICNVYTLPNDGELIFGPVGDVVVGHGSNPLDQKGSPYLQNNSGYDLSFDKFCVKRFDSDAVGSEKALKSGNGSGEYCVDIGHDVIYGYETISLEDYGIYPDYTGNKNGIPANADYGSAKLKTSIKSDIDRDGTVDELYDSYLSSELRVRVAKPAVITTGGGVSFVKDSKTTGDVEKVTSGVDGYNQDTNKNFVGTSASDSEISSHSDSITDTTKIEEEKDKYEETVDSVTDTTTVVSRPSVSGYSHFDNYNGLGNVFIVTAQDVTLSGGPSVSEPTTYIIEGGDLRITGNIESNQNIAFVVKGGNIIIDDAVSTIDGTYISIPTASGGGDINGTDDTDTQLVVNGSLYGDISGLIFTRHYISNDSTQLGVGTIVAFGSSLFTKPAPLVSQFIGEYLAAEKIAK